MAASLKSNIRGIRGVEQVIRNIRLKNKRLGAGCERGIKLASLFLLRESQRLVPVDTGTLKASGFARTTGKGYGTRGGVGYTAAYAIFVHENVEMKLKGQPRPGGRGRFWDPQGRGQAKFLEEPARRHAVKIRGIIRDSMRIK